MSHITSFSSFSFFKEVELFVVGLVIKGAYPYSLKYIQFIVGLSVLMCSVNKVYLEKIVRMKYKLFKMQYIFNVDLEITMLHDVDFICFQ